MISSIITDILVVGAALIIIILTVGPILIWDVKYGDPDVYVDPRP
jgi:hypothetical protein